MAPRLSCQRPYLCRPLWQQTVDNPLRGPLQSILFVDVVLCCAVHPPPRYRGTLRWGDSRSRSPSRHGSLPATGTSGRDDTSRPSGSSRDRDRDREKDRERDRCV